MSDESNGWNQRKRAVGYTLPTSPPRWRPAPVVSIKTLCAIKGSETLTATWHHKDGCWKLVSFLAALSFLSGCDDYLDAMPLLAAHGWTGRWHDSSMQVPVPILELQK